MPIAAKRSTIMISPVVQIELSRMVRSICFAACPEYLDPISDIPTGYASMKTRIFMLDGARRLIISERQPAIAAGQDPRAFLPSISDDVWSNDWTSQAKEVLRRAEEEAFGEATSWSLGDAPLHVPSSTEWVLGTSKFPRAFLRAPYFIGDGRDHVRTHHARATAHDWARLLAMGWRTRATWPDPAFSTQA